MPGLIHEHQYESDKAAICAKHPSAEDAFDAVEWALVHAHWDDLSRLEAAELQNVRYFSTAGTRHVPQIIVVIGRERADGVVKLVLLAARVADP